LVQQNHGFLCDVLFRGLFAFVIAYFKLRHVLNGPAPGSNLLTDALEGLPPTWEGIPLSGARRVRAFALQEQIAVELPPRPNHYPNKSNVLFGHFRRTSRHSHTTPHANNPYRVIYPLGTTFGSSIKRVARATRVSVADRIESQQKP